MTDRRTLKAVRRQPMDAHQLLEMAAVQHRPEPPQLVPPDDVRLILTTLMELLQEHRGELHKVGRGLKNQYEVFACALRDSGFRFDETEDRQARAERQRRIGERAEARGNVDGAIVFYELALQSWSEIGCRRRVTALKAIHRR